MQKKMKQMMLAKMFTNFSIVLYLIIGTPGVNLAWKAAYCLSCKAKSLSWSGVVIIASFILLQR